MFSKKATIELGGRNSGSIKNTSRIVELWLLMSREEEILITKMFSYGVSIMVPTKDGPSSMFLINRSQDSPVKLVRSTSSTELLVSTLEETSDLCLTFHQGEFSQLKEAEMLSSMTETIPTFKYSTTTQLRRESSLRASRISASTLKMPVTEEEKEICRSGPAMVDGSRSSSMRASTS